MGEEYNNTSFDVKKRTSPKDEIESQSEKINNVLKVFRCTLSGKPLTSDDYNALDGFLGDNNQNAKRAISLYWEAISELSSDISSQEAKIFANNMTHILLFIAAQKDRLEMHLYKDRFDELLEDSLEARVLDIMLSNNVTKLSHNQLVCIQKTIQVWSNTEAALNYLDIFNTFKTRMINDGKLLADDLEYSYFLNYSKKYIYSLEEQKYKQAQKSKQAQESEYSQETEQPKETDQETDQFEKEIMILHEQNWIERVLAKLQTGDVDAVWKDDITMVMLQMLDSGMYKDSIFVQNNQDRIRNIREAFANSKSLSDDKIREAFAVMNPIVLKYRDKEINDPEAIKAFVDAYKTVFLKEMVSEPKTPPVKYSDDYARFIIMQMNAFKKYGEKTNFDWETLIERASLDLALKEENKMIHDKYDDVKKNSVIVLIKPNGIYENIRGKIRRLENSAIFCFGDPFDRWCENGLEMIEVIGHENTHIVSGNFNFASKDIDFDSYMEYKTLLSSNYVLGLLNINYENLYYEIRARIGQTIAQLETFKKFQITDDKQYWGDIIDTLKHTFLNTIYDSLMNKLAVPPIGRKEYSVKVFDDVYEEHKEQIKTSKESTPLSDIFMIEYKEDGTPKTFKEIIQDQENEMETGNLVPTSGPQKPLDRIIFRMRMMMQRAIAYGKENEFVDVINNFIKNNHDELYKHDFFETLFPQGKVPSEGESQTIFEELFDEGQKYEWTEIAYGIYKINERIQLKEASKYDEEKETFFTDYTHTIMSRWNAYTRFSQDAKIRLNTDMQHYEDYTIN